MKELQKHAFILELGVVMATAMNIKHRQDWSRQTYQN
jgi:hypothetical protein